VTAFVDHASRCDCACGRGFGCATGCVTCCETLSGCASSSPSYHVKTFHDFAIGFCVTHFL